MKMINMDKTKTMVAYYEPKRYQ